MQRGTHGIPHKKRRKVQSNEMTYGPTAGTTDLSRSGFRETRRFGGKAEDDDRYRASCTVLKAIGSDLIFALFLVARVLTSTGTRKRKGIRTAHLRRGRVCTLHVACRYGDVYTCPSIFTRYGERRRSCMRSLSYPGYRSPATTFR